MLYFTINFQMVFNCFIFKSFETADLFIFSDYNLASGTVMEYFSKSVDAGESFNTSMQRLNWDVTKVIQHFTINGKEIENTEKDVWRPVVDSVLGLCYTFDPRKFQNGSVPIKYHAYNGQIHHAEIHLKFDVSIHLIQSYTVHEVCWAELFSK